MSCRKPSAERYAELNSNKTNEKGLKISALLKFPCGQFDYKIDIVVRGGAVSADRAAFFAFMHDNESLFRVGLSLYRLKPAAAFARAVAGVFVHVQRPKAMRTMVSRRISERLYLAPAMRADKAVIIFPKSLFFHVSSRNTVPPLAPFCCRRSGSIFCPLYHSADTADPPSGFRNRGDIYSP